MPTLTLTHSTSLSSAEKSNECLKELRRDGRSSTPRPQVIGVLDAAERSLMLQSAAALTGEVEVNLAALPPLPPRPGRSHPAVGRSGPGMDRSDPAVDRSGPVVDRSDPASGMLPAVSARGPAGAAAPAAAQRRLAGLLRRSRV